MKHFKAVWMKRYNTFSAEDGYFISEISTTYLLKIKQIFNRNRDTIFFNYKWYLNYLRVLI